jgi:hypothetical protein
LDTVDSPAAHVGCLLEFVSSLHDVVAVGAGEAVEVLRRRVVRCWAIIVAAPARRKALLAGRVIWATSV